MNYIKFNVRMINYLLKTFIEGKKNVEYISKKDKHRFLL